MLIITEKFLNAIDTMTFLGRVHLSAVAMTIENFIDLMLTVAVKWSTNWENFEVSSHACPASRRKPLIAAAPTSANQNSAMINPNRIKAEAARNREFNCRKTLVSEDTVGGNLAQ